MVKKFKKHKPILVADGEWWFYGCFIQQQYHPMLAKFLIFKDTVGQEDVGTCHTFTEAKVIAKNNQVIDFTGDYITPDEVLAVTENLQSEK
jgi:hypothetical protein